MINEFNGRYATNPPWEIGRPQPALLRIAEAGGLRGPVLDVGCGTGEHALLAARLGFDAHGVDVSPAAVTIARWKAMERGLDAMFYVRDALDLTSLGVRFDTVLDSAMFHVLADVDRESYESAVRAVVRDGGRYHLLCFSDEEPGTWGPRRVTRDEICATFATGWRVERIESARLELSSIQDSVRAWLATIQRVQP